MTGSMPVGPHVPPRLAEIQARFGMTSGRRQTSAFDAVLSGTGLSGTGLSGTGLSSDPLSPEISSTTASSGAAGAASLAAAGGDGSLASLLSALASGSTNTAGIGATVTGAGADPGQDVVDAAKAYLGVPYLWGGTDPTKGLDCSGLVQLAFDKIGVDMPKWSRDQATMGVPVASLDDAVPGDLLTFGKPVSHVGIYLGDGKMINAPKKGDVVKIEPIGRTIGSIRRIVAPAVTTPVVGSDPANAAPDATASPTEAAGPVAGSGWQPGGAEARYQSLFEAAGEKWNVDPKLLAAVAQTESAFNPSAVSPAGAQGLMQFMPATAAEMGVDPFDPASAIDGAAHYLRLSLDQFDTSEEAIASYNAGRGAVRRYGGVPPYRETQNYVQKVLDAWRARS